MTMWKRALQQLIGRRSIGLKVAAAGSAIAAVAAAVSPAFAEPAACLSFDPSVWPAPSKPYFMIAFDTSGSMTSAIPTNNSCAYPNNRLGHGRCAMKNTFQAFAGQVNFGLATYAKVQKSCAGACFTGCVYSDFTGNSGLAGCGPEPGCGSPNSGCRQGANVVVPMLIDNYYAPPPNASNISELLKWVDNDCSDQKELFASGNTPLNGILRDMYKYLSTTWTGAYAGSATYPSPLADLAAGERPCRSVNVILVTDGDETCDTQADAVDAAADLYAGFTKGGINWKVKTYVINFAGGSGAATDAIAAAGGTTSSLFATNETDLSIGLAGIVASAIKPEICNNTDDNCNGCTDEGFVHYCNKQQTCCNWATQPERATCLANFQATITAANPTGDLTLLPCTTATQQGEPANWLCYNPKEACDNNDNNCVDGVDENVNKCGNPLHCPTPEVCNSQDDDCDGLIDEGLGASCNCVPSPEICDGCDNDCDGIADNGIAAIPCGLANPPNCIGTLSCKAPQPVPVGTCVMGGGYNTCQNSPQTETCDGIDNDCDGATDDGIPPVDCVPNGFPPNLDYGPNSQCKKGKKPCGSNACTGFVGPSAEICDGIDNDCDGQVDENPFGAGTPCGINQPPCSTGTTACVNGALVCQGGTQPGAEVCDGVDNDCDGQVDETPLADAPPPGQNGCWTLPGNCCTYGNLTWCPPPGGTCAGTGSLTPPCNEGKLICQGLQKWVCSNPIQPAPEACDGLDNDCNGMVDDGSIAQVGQPCGSDVGECIAGTIACMAGTLDCLNDVGPTSEICDGKDNDCEGTIDNGISSGDTCQPTYDTVLYPGDRSFPPCQPGVQQCDGSGSSTCVGAIGPSPEICDGLDNDCDGKVDEKGPAPNGIDGTADPSPPMPPLGDIGQSCGVAQGLCTEGTIACVNGDVVCVGGADATDEQCDCLDNDCDLTTDEQDPGKPPICSPGKECVKSGNSCACAEPCKGGEFPCPPGQKCEDVTKSEDGTPLGSYCVPDNCGDCASKTVKDANNVVLCAPANTPADANCNKPPVCVCKGQTGCKDPCDGVTCSNGQVCTNFGPDKGKCVVDNCYNVPCLGCNKACHLGSCLDNPCKADSCKPDEQCTPSGDFTTFTCVPSCSGVMCPSGQTCKSGECAPTCAPACGAGQVCDTTSGTPTCVDNKCTSGCGANGGCCNPLTGLCGDCPCEGVVCPQGQTCTDGICGDTSSSSSSSASSSGSGMMTSTNASSGSGNMGAGGAGGDNGGVFGLPTGGGGCACSTASETAPSTGWLVVFGLPLILVRRRRATRKENA